MAEEEPTPKGGSKAVRTLAAVLVLVLLIFLYTRFGGPLQGVLERAQGWIEGTGPWAPVVFIVVYIGVTVACLSAWALTGIAGVLFGPVLGLVLVSVASTTGATCSFLIARYLAKGRIEGRMQNNEHFQKLARMTERHGVMIVALTRLIPLFPFTLLNYGFGLTRVRLVTYVVFSWLFMLPGTAMFVLGGSAFTAKNKVPITIALAVLVLGMAAVGHYGRAYMKRNMDEGKEEGDQKPEPADGE